MSQHDMDVANQGYPAFRSDMNDALQALASNSSGVTEPSTTFAYQWWYDETDDILKMRNADNDDWIAFASFDQSTDTWYFTSLDIDNINIDGNTISASDTDGDLNLKANGTGNTNLQTPSDDDAVVVDDNGHVTMPLQSSFMAMVGSTVSNVTGNGTAHTVIYGTEIYDQNSDYNNATGVYTGPVAARMLFAGGVEMLNCNGMTAGFYILITSNRSYTGWSSGDITNGNNYVAQYARYADIDAADIVSSTIQINGLGSDSADLNGNAGVGVSTFGGSIIC